MIEDHEPIEDELMPLPAWLTAENADEQEVLILFLENWKPGVPDEDE